jgi:hypothetical protein
MRTEKLRAWMAAAGKSQDDLARSWGKSKAYTSMVINNKIRMNADCIEFFIAETGYSVERLFDVSSGPDQRGYGYNKNEWRHKLGNA